MIVFLARKGEFIFIHGSSGSGKSTFLTIVGGLDRASRGKVWFEQHQPIRLNEAEPTRYRRVQVGKDDFARVLDGLQDGDRVIARPSDQVVAGVRVVPLADGTWRWVPLTASPTRLLPDRPRPAPLLRPGQQSGAFRLRYFARQRPLPIPCAILPAPKPRSGCPAAVHPLRRS